MLWLHQRKNQSRGFVAVFDLQPLEGTKVEDLEPQVKTFGFAAGLPKDLA